MIRECVPWRITALALSALVSLVVAAPALATEEGPVDGRAKQATSITTLEIGELGQDQQVLVVSATVTGEGVNVPADPRTLDSSRSVGALSTEACWWAKPTATVNGGENKAWYYIEWCGANGVVTKVLTLTCNGSGTSGWTHTGCSVSRGALGFSSVTVLGHWDYRYGCCGVYLYRWMEVDARHNHNGTYSGTWYAGQ